MRFLDLDFQPRRFSAIGIALLAAGLLATAAAGLGYRNAASKVAAWQGELASLQQPARRIQLPRGDDKELQQIVQATDAVARDIRRPWDALFAALEEAKTDEVALLAINPDAVKGGLRITGEAKRREAILAFVGRLGQQSGVLRNVVLVEDQLQQQDPEKPFRFLVAADWAGAS